MRHRTTRKDIVIALLSGIGGAVFMAFVGGGLIIVFWSIGMGKFDGWPFDKIETVMFLVILTIASIGIGVMVFRTTYRVQPYRRFRRRNGHSP